MPRASLPSLPPHRSSAGRRVPLGTGAGLGPGSPGHAAGRGGERHRSVAALRHFPSHRIRHHKELAGALRDGPAGTGAVAAGPPRAAADRYGYVIVSSYRTQSDSAPDPTEAAFLAMFAETRRRVRVDHAPGLPGGLFGHGAGRVGLRLPADRPCGGNPGRRSGPAQWLVTARPAQRGPGTGVLRHRGERRLQLRRGSSGSTPRSIARAYATTWPFSMGRTAGRQNRSCGRESSGSSSRRCAPGPGRSDTEWIDSLYQARLETGRGPGVEGRFFGAWQRYRLTVGDFDGIMRHRRRRKVRRGCSDQGRCRHALKQQRKNVKLSGRVPGGGAAICREGAGIERSHPGLRARSSTLKIRELQREVWRPGPTRSRCRRCAGSCRIRSWCIASYESSDAFRDEQPGAGTGTAGCGRRDPARFGERMRSAEAGNGNDGAGHIRSGAALPIKLIRSLTARRPCTH